VKRISISKSSKQYKPPTVLIVDQVKHLLLHTLFFSWESTRCVGLYKEF